jgi:hypothetical protein
MQLLEAVAILLNADFFLLSLVEQSKNTIFRL